jgi:SOS response regulatory protein OraA/RecX
MSSSVQSDDPQQAVRRQAMRLLARREYGDLELIRVLCQRGFERQVAKQAVALLTEQGLQSNGRYQEHVVRARQRRGYGPLWLQALFAEHCSSQEYALPESGWEAPAVAWLIKRARIRGHMQPNQARAALHARGLTQAHIERVLRVWQSKRSTEEVVGDD